MTNLQQIPKTQAITLIRNLTTEQLDRIINSLNQEIVKLKGIKKELFKL